MKKLQRPSKKILADVGLLSVVFLWGSSFVVTKNSLDSVNAVALVAYRFLLSAILLGIFLVLRKEKLFQDFRQGILLGLILFAFYIPQTLGLNYTSASNSGFITGMLVIFVPVFAFLLFKKRPTLLNIITVGIAITGLWILTGGIQKFNAGDTLTLITACAGALHILVADKYAKNTAQPLTLHFQQLLTVGLLSVLACVVFRLPFNVDSQYAINSIIYLAITSSLYGYGMQMLAQKHTSPVSVSLIFTLEPVFAALFAWTIGGEQFQWIKVIGGSLIVLSTITQEIPWNYRHKKE